MMMSSRRLTTLGAFLLGVSAGVVAGCQTYDFQPVSPLALKQTTYSDVKVSRNLKPSVMLLVDKSGSMDSPVDPSNPACALNDGGVCGYWIPDGVNKVVGNLCDVNNCPTRWSALQGAISSFVQDAGNVARLGLSTFPSDVFCGSGITLGPPIAITGNYHASDLRADIVQSEVDSDLFDAGFHVRDILNGIASDQPAGSLNGTGGGTPTNSALTEVGGLDSLHDLNRKKFILLLTDGVPNCNPFHDFAPNGQPDGYTCVETAMCTDSLGVLDAACGPPSYQLGCLNDSDTVSTIAGLAGNQAIQTFVVGFGADATAGPAPGVLNAMALAGGQPRLCGVDGGDNGLCGADTCDNSHVPFSCGHAYYQASNQDELSNVLATIGTIIDSNPCLIDLAAAPTDPTLLSVLVNEQTIPGVDPSDGGTNWVYALAVTADGGTVPTLTFEGLVCSTIANSTPNSPVSIEIRVVQAL